MTRVWVLVSLASGLIACGPSRSEIDGGATDADLVRARDTGHAADDAALVCRPGTIACDGACTRVAADALNCGSCGNSCPAHVGCANGRCDCAEPHLSCDGVCIDPTSARDHCGSCERACGASEMCALGHCIPLCTDPGLAVCVDTDPTTHVRTPTCTDVRSDPMHCGSCDHACGANADCVGGACVCTRSTSCMGACVDLMTDAEHCGNCYASCGADGVCIDGICRSCGAGLTSCGTPAHCVDLATSVLSCGSCNHTCPIGTSCRHGVCDCGSGLTACGTSCVDVSTDDTNCGRCGRVCQSMSACTAGACACATGLTDCGENCVDVDTDLANCRGCGLRCGTGGSCTSGGCVCGPGYVMCDPGHCVRTDADRDHCGSCGHACAAGEVCFRGACSALPTHYVDAVPTASEAPWIDACGLPGHVDALITTEGGSTVAALPFPFRFWATDLAADSLINICSSGWLGMDGEASRVLEGVIPSISPPTSVIAVHRGDLYTGPLGVCIATVGVEPLRQFVVEWGHATYPGDTTAALTFEVVLSETTGTIDFIYQTARNARSYVEGIEDATGTIGVGGCGATTFECAPASDTRVRFVPVP